MSALRIHCKGTPLVWEVVLLERGGRETGVVAFRAMGRRPVPEARFASRWPRIARALDARAHLEASREAGAPSTPEVGAVTTEIGRPGAPITGGDGLRAGCEKLVERWDQSARSGRGFGRTAVRKCAAALREILVADNARRTADNEIDRLHCFARQAVSGWLFNSLEQARNDRRAAENELARVQEELLALGADPLERLLGRIPELSAGELMRLSRALHADQQRRCAIASETGAALPPKHYCTGSACPGLPWPASFMPHPIACVGAGAASDPEAAIAGPDGGSTQAGGHGDWP